MEEDVEVFVSFLRNFIRKYESDHLGPIEISDYLQEISELADKVAKKLTINRVNVDEVPKDARKSANVCKNCRRQFATKRLLENHMRSTHDKKEALVRDQQLSFYCCQNCNSCCIDAETFERRKCCENPSSFIPDEKLLADHNRFACEFCGEKFRQFGRIKYHLKKCRGKSFSCEQCDYSAGTRRNLAEHKRDRHGELKAFACDECPKRFKLNASLQKHLAKRHEKGETSYQCDNCDKRFVKKVYLTNHKNRFHKINKEFLCQTCGDRFSTEQSLKSHAEIHAGVKRFQCSECGKSFRRKDKLDFHVAIHTQVKPFQCSLCPKAFIRKSKLQEHLRRHTGEKRFLCVACDKTYSGSYDLRQHLRRHHPNIGQKIRANIPLTPQIIQNMNFSS